MEILLKVPVKNFVKKYIATKYGHPWVLSERYSEGRIFKNLLERAPDRYETYLKSDTNLEIQISTRLFLKYGSYISQSKIDEFTDIIRDKILEEIETYHFSVTSGIGFKRNNKIRIMLGSKERRCAPDQATKFFTRKETIYDILNKYGISDADLSFDSIAKHIQRSNKHKKTVHF